MQIKTEHSSIVLCTLNAKYIHSAFGLRYLKANMGQLNEQTTLVEFTIHDHILEMTEKLLSHNPTILGFGVYIWNVRETLALMKTIRTISPNTILVIGGPEVSHEWQKQEIVEIADYLITGEAEVTFPKLCQSILMNDQPEAKVHYGVLPVVTDLVLPYSLYTDEDVQHRVMYVEASRGCPFKCQFCLSSLDKKVRNFDLSTLLVAFDDLIARGATQFKFVDRTFNLKVKTSIAILEYFLTKLEEVPTLFLHFEMIPDRFPLELRDYVTRFPKGQIQFEIGIQTFNPDVAARIQRRQNYTSLDDNIEFLRPTGVHLHTDLIIGLPGETVESFAKGFDKLVHMGVEEIQVGILKRLNGAPIAMHSKDFEQVYSPNPPYEILANSVLSFTTLARLRRFARYWNIIGNSGRFQSTLLLFLEQESPFYTFLDFSDWLYDVCGRTTKISYNKMLQYLQQFWTEVFKSDITPTLSLDYQRTTGKHHTPRFLMTTEPEKVKRSQSLQSRQRRHIQESR